MEKQAEVAGAESGGDESAKDSRKAMVVRRLMEQAAHIFAEKGYPGTTLTDIGEAVGLTRAAVYYYFKNKEALLEAIVEELTSAPISNIARWRETAPPPGPERLRAFVKMRVTEVLSRQTQMRMIGVVESVLPPDLAERHTLAKRRVLGEYRSILREGMEAGAFRAQDDSVAAFALIGMVNWTAQWFSPGRGASVEEVADQIAAMAVNSIAVPADRSAGFADPASAVKMLRDDLDQLALLIDRSGAE